MLQIPDRLVDWWRAGHPVGLATVVSTWDGAPRAVGSVLAVGPDGEVVGGLAGGCVEGAAYDLAARARDGAGAVTRSFGVSDAAAAEYDLPHGGVIEIFVDRLEPRRFPVLDQVVEHVRARRPVGVATVLEHPREELVGSRVVLGHAAVRSGTTGCRDLDEHLADAGGRLIDRGTSGILRCGPGGERGGRAVRVLVAVPARPPRMIVFGADDRAQTVARTAGFLGYHVTICDGRRRYASRVRFPGADEVVVSSPHRYLAEQARAGMVDSRTVLAVLTEEGRVTVPLLEVALRLPVGHVGLPDPTAVRPAWVRRLRDAGLTGAELARLAAGGHPWAPWSEEVSPRRAIG